MLASAFADALHPMLASAFADALQTMHFSASLCIALNFSLMQCSDCQCIAIHSPVTCLRLSLFHRLLFSLIHFSQLNGAKSLKTLVNIWQHWLEDPALDAFMHRTLYLCKWCLMVICTKLGPPPPISEVTVKCGRRQMGGRKWEEYATSVFSQHQVSYGGNVHNAGRRNRVP